MPFKDLCLALALYPIYVSLCESPVLRWKCFILLVTCQLEILSFDLNEGYSCSLRFLLTRSHVRARSLSHTHTHAHTHTHTHICNFNVNRVMLYMLFYFLNNQLWTSAIRKTFQDRISEASWVVAVLPKSARGPALGPLDVRLSRLTSAASYTSFHLSD